MNHILILIYRCEEEIQGKHIKLALFFIAILTVVVVFFRRVKENEQKKKEAKESGGGKVDCKRKVIYKVVSSFEVVIYTRLQIMCTYL